MQNFRYPLRTLTVLSIITLLSCYGAIQFYGEQGKRNQTQLGQPATLLANGEVLVAGGGNATGLLPSAELGSRC
jgi:hypothetical protein